MSKVVGDIAIAVEAETAGLINGLNSGKVSVQDFGVKVEQMGKRLKRAEGQSRSMGGAFRNLGNVSNRTRAQIQNTSFQLQDMAVQFEMGTKTSRILAQQLPQLLGGFGPIGAVVGVLAGVGIPALSLAFENLGGKTEDAKEKTLTFAQKVSSAEGALGNMAASARAASVGGLEDLRKKYGEITNEVRGMMLELHNIDKRSALREVQGIIGVVKNEIAAATEASAGVVSSALGSAGTEAAKAEAATYRTEIENIEKDIRQRERAGLFINPSELKILGEMKEELAALEGDFSNLGSLASEIDLSPKLLSSISEAQRSLEAASNAGDFAEMANQLSIIRGLLVQAGDTIKQEVIDGITKAEALAREQAKRLEEGAAAADDIANSTMDETIASAARNAGELRDRLREAASEFGVISKLNESNPDFFDPRGEGRSGVFDPNNRGTGPELIPVKTKKKTGGGGRGRSSAGGADAGLDAIRQRFASEQELLDINLASTLEKLDEFHASKALKESEYHELSEKAKKDHLDKIEKLERDKQSARLQMVGGALGDLASLMQTGNAKLFKVGQAAAVAEAVVSGYGAAVSAWEKGMKVGGPPVAAAFTAASLAKTGALISGITSQSSTGGSAAATAGGVGGAVGGAGASGPVQTREFQVRGNNVLGLEELFSEINEGIAQGHRIRIDYAA